MIQDIVSILFLAGGAFFLLVSTVGLLRLPDFFSRTHAVGKSETLGGLLLLIGLAVHNGLALESAKLFLIVLFVAVTNPAGIHTLARAALRSGAGIWTGPEDTEIASTGAKERSGDEVPVRPDPNAGEVEP